MSIGQIIDGTLKNLFNQEEEFYRKRITVCRKCKLRKIDTIFGEMCNPSMYLNPDTDEISSEEKPGFFSGCGCILGSKTRVRELECPVGKWKAE